MLVLLPLAVVAAGWLAARVSVAGQLNAAVLVSIMLVLWFFLDYDTLYLFQSAAFGTSTRERALRSVIVVGAPCAVMMVCAVWPARHRLSGRPLAPHRVLSFLGLIPLAWTNLNAFVDLHLQLHTLMLLSSTALAWHVVEGARLVGRRWCRGVNRGARRWRCLPAQCSPQLASRRIARRHPRAISPVSTPVLRDSRSNSSPGTCAALGPESPVKPPVQLTDALRNNGRGLAGVWPAPGCGASRLKVAVLAWARMSRLEPGSAPYTLAHGAGEALHRVLARNPRLAERYFSTWPLLRWLPPHAKQKLMNSVASTSWPELRINPQRVRVGRRTDILLRPHPGEFDIASASGTSFVR